MIKAKPGAWLPYQKQYSLKQEAIQSIKAIIVSLLEVLVRTKSPFNTPIFPAWPESSKCNSKLWNTCGAKTTYPQTLKG